MTAEVKFLAYVVEAYKAAKGMSGREVFVLFERTGALRYVLASADALHTTGAEYTIGQIDDFIANHS
ncbi:MAG: DUF3791 domain-containing protein [Propionibacteriaceae bacterium]|jgi:hypothetical protein|nr:DUF3791 domain-containing protein [Propionibacteriaceae bacterium]